MKAADVTCTGVVFFLYPFLIVIRLLAQLALVPLLLFQVLSTTLGSVSLMIFTVELFLISTGLD